MSSAQFLRRPPQSYIQAIKMSSAKRLLVEGIADQQIISRLVSELEGLNLIRVGLLEIDSAEMIDASDSGYWGNKDLVLGILSMADQDTKSKLVGFVDREWEHLSIAVPGVLIEDIATIDEIPVSGIAKTYGHSIENYVLGLESVTHAIDVMLPHPLSARVAAMMRLSYDDILIDCAALSVSAWQHNRVDHIRGRFSNKDACIHVLNGRVLVNWDELRSSLNRHPKFGEQLSTTVISRSAEHRRSLENLPANMSRWIVDGKLLAHCMRASIISSCREVSGNPNMLSNLSIPSLLQACCVGWCRRLLADDERWPKVVNKAFAQDSE